MAEKIKIRLARDLITGKLVKVGYISKSHDVSWKGHLYPSNRFYVGKNVRKKV